MPKTLVIVSAIVSSFLSPIMVFYLHYQPLHRFSLLGQWDFGRECLFSGGEAARGFYVYGLNQTHSALLVMAIQAVNPFVCPWRLDNFRRAFKGIVKCCACKSYSPQVYVGFESQSLSTVANVMQLKTPMKDTIYLKQKT